MKILNYFFALFVLVLVFTGCKNDVDLNAPYKEYPSIYAVLNTYDAVNTIRINKVFLGEGDANVMAKVSDSVNYQPGELTVTLRYHAAAYGKTVSGTITFTEAIVETAPGAFSTNQRVYQTNETLPSAITIFSTGSTVNSAIVPVYTLTVLNNHTGNVFTATASPAPQVRAVGVQYGDLVPPYLPPNDHVGGINYAYADPPKTNDVEYIDYANRAAKIYFPMEENAEVYQLVITTLFSNDVGNGNTTYDSFDYVFANLRNRDAGFIGSSTLGSKYLKAEFKPADYFLNAGVVLGKKNLGQVLSRKLEVIEYNITTSTQEYLDYLEYARPSLSFNQNKPLYSNFDNKAALGIFTFRARVSIQKLPTKPFINAFSYNNNTCMYKFRDVNGVIQGCGK